VAANFRNRISKQPMRSLVMEGRGLPFFLGGRGGGWIFLKESGLSPLDFLCKLFFFFFFFLVCFG
jgi:hypothetical protein